jgi:hypothetical protein
MSAGRTLRRGLVLAVIVYALWLGWRGLSFRRYGSPGAAAGVPNGVTAADIPRAFEIEGVYHMHSRFSDGSGTVDAIAAAAAEAKLDFVVLTDHGAPNREALAAAGRAKGVLVLCGTEISSNRGHLVALGFDTPARDFDRAAETAAGEAAALGGFTIIAHPYSKVSWSWGEWAGYSGLEILNADTEVKRSLPRSLLYAPLLLLRPDAALLALVARPEREIAAWDRWGAARSVRAYYAADAHFAYRALFRLFHLHVLLDERPAGGFDAARRQIFGALHAGRFYNAIEAAADAGGFRFWAVRSGRITPMGSSVAVDASASGPARLIVRAPFVFAHEIRLLRDGRPVASSRGADLVLETIEPGAYRAEVYLRERTPLRSNVPWIASNSILLFKDKP